MGDERDDARRERDEAHLRANTLKAAFDLEVTERKKLETENEALKAEVERLKLEGVTDRARAMLNDVTNERNGLHNEIAAIRAKLERAEAVCEVASQGPCRHAVDQGGCPMCVALAKWREGKK